ncbi:MAG TPA: translation initiation factor IF-2 N-terminal domain-containing protein, partial [Albitalea sp.]|nr:translation initiation factor IF-2 N-terminal domain-containing protein [Albitalea sp.]
MAVTTVAQLAAELNRSATALLEQLQSAGVSKASTDDALTDSDKERLLDHLRSAHGTAGGERKKITLTRKSTSEIKQADASGKARTIQVEVRKKRTFVKRDDTPAESPAAPVDDQDELQRRELEAQAQAELLRRQEAELEEKRRQREEQARLEREAAEVRQREAAEAAAKAAAEAEVAAKAAAAAPAPKKGDKAAPAAAPVVVAAPVAPVEPPKPALRVIKAADVVDEEKQRAADLAKRRKAAEDEAAAIRAMMSAPKKVLTAKKAEEPKPEAGKEGIKGTIHKAAAVPGAPVAPGSVAKPGDKKSIKSEKLSSSWADDAAKKRALKAAPRGAPGAGRAGWRAPRGGRRGDRHDGGGSTFVAPAEQQIQEVHIPETISVADLAHKMSVKASEVIKQLMKLGQM